MKMSRQLTTSLTDALVTWSVLYFIYNVFWVNFFACVGLGIQGTAAALGVIRFAQSRPQSQIYDYHQMMFWLSQVVGLPLLAVGFCHKDMPVMMNLNLMIMAAVLIGSNFLAPGMRQLATESCAGFGMLTIIIVSVRTWNIYAVLASAVYIVSSKVIGTEGKMGIFLRVDIHHVGISLGIVPSTGLLYHRQGFCTMYPLCLTWCNLKLTLKKRKKLILCGVLLIGTIWLIFSHNAAQIRKEVNILRALPCSDTHSREIISSICSLYKKGEIVGDLCEPLCNKKLVQFVRCLNYKHGKFVVHVECTQICKQHETVPAVLKMIHEDVSNNTLKEIDKELSIHMHLQDKIDTINIHANTITAESLSLLIQDLLASEYGITPREGQDMLNVLWDEYGNYFTGTSTNLIFARSFWSVVRQNEYRISKVFSDWDVFPKIYGSCGALYLAENAPALTTFSKMSYFISGYPSWTSRAKTAISILHLVRMMETMEHPLHLCDIKSPHFGVMPNNEIKFIDADTVFADETLSHDLGAPNCSDHADCAFFDCDGWCQKSTGRCIPLRTNNNLQMVCAKIFKASFLSTYGGLLSSPPSAVAEELTNLVNSCAQDVTQLYQEQIEMRKPDLGVLFKLTEYLTKSLNMETNS